MRKLVATILFSGAVVFLVLALIATYDRLPEGAFRLRLGWSALAVCTFAAAAASVAMVWRVVLRGLGTRLSRAESVRIVSLAQLGKYVPGGIWQPIAWLRLGRTAGVPVQTGLLAMIAHMTVSISAALIVGVPLTVSAGGGGMYLLLLLLIPVAVAAVHPTVVGRVARVFPGMRSGEPGQGGGGLSFSEAGVAVVLSLPAWVLYGTGTALMGEGLQIARLSDWTLVTGAFCIAWVAGYLALPVPGGLGVREATMIGLLQISMGVPQAVALAVGSRLFLTVAEAVMALIAVAVPARSAGEPVRQVRA